MKDAALDAYFAAHSVAQPMRVDVVLALLRTGRLREAEELAGCAIKRCPPAIPPWPPKPVAAPQAQLRRVSHVARNPCLPTTDAFQRYRKVRVGMTEQQLLSRGITRRDITRWAKLKHLRFNK